MLVAYLHYRRAGEPLARGSDAPRGQRPLGRRVHASTRSGGTATRSRRSPTPFRSWLADLEKRDAGGPETSTSALGEGLALIRAAAARATDAADRPGPRRPRGPDRAGRARRGRRDGGRAIAELGRLMDAPPRSGGGDAGRARARGGRRSRSARASPPGTSSSRARARRLDRSATFTEAEAQLARASRRWASTSSTCRRSTRSAAPTARAATTRWSRPPAIPAARGRSAARTGGYTAVHPDLGTLDDFDRFVEAAHRLGLEVALDFAIQCSPDHPWVREHPEWFFHRPDGTIKYAENPPKKYQDIYPLNFQCEAARRALGGDAADPRVLDRPRRAHVPRGQSPHQAGEVLGVADPRGPGRASRTSSSWPRRSPAPR